MNKFRFLQVYSDPTPDTFPVSAAVMAETSKDATHQFAKEHGLEILEVGAEDVWFRKGKVELRYLSRD